MNYLTSPLISIIWIISKVLTITNSTIIVIFALVICTIIVLGYTEKWNCWIKEFEYFKLI